MKCFIIYSYKTDVSVIKKIIEEHGIISIVPIQSLESGTIILDEITGQLKDCDFVISVLDESPNVLFEVGLACGMKKQIFAVIQDKKEMKLLKLLSKTTYVFADVNDYDKIKFSFDLFIENLPTKVDHRKISNKKEIRKVKPTFDYLSSLDKLNELAPSEFEDFVGDILKKINIDVVAENKFKENDFQSDFSLWIDELNSTFGNPILVETKFSGSHQNLKNGINQLSNYLEKYNTKTGLLIYNNPNRQSFNDLFSYYPLVISISIQELIHKLTEETFSEILIELRNKAFHK